MWSDSSQSESCSDCPDTRFKGDDLSWHVAWIGLALTLRFFKACSTSSSPSKNMLIRSLVGVRRPGLRFAADAVISLKACLEAPIFPPRGRDDRGVKNLVKVLGVTVGRALSLFPLLFTGTTGEEKTPSSVAVALLCDANGA